MPTLTRLFDFPRYQLNHCPLDVSLATKIEGQWHKLSTSEYVELADWFSLGLIELGVNPGDRVAIISHNNRYEWNVCDIGTLQVGAVDVPIYPTISEDDNAYILNDSGCKYCFVSNAELFEKIKRIQSRCPELKEIYTFLPVEGASSWLEVIELGKRSDNNQELKSRMDAVKTEDLATLIYTSGTTGVPKGVMLSHRNIATNSTECEDRIPVTAGAWALSFLPVCHVYERMLMYLYCWRGIPIYFGQSLETVGDDIREVKPHIFTAVPRLLEKVFDKIMAKGAELKGIKRLIFYWALGLAEQYELSGTSNWYNFRLKLARKLVFSKWKEALGGNVVAVVSGSAALNPRIGRIFLAAGINVQEGYGLTETSPVISVNGSTNDDKRIGHVGRPIRNVEVKIAEDGEILVKGPNVMMGYYNQPEKTAEVINSDGWFHTGDIGEIEADGHLRITDRKKEMFKTSGGKYVAPQIMENTFKESRFIEQLIVIGDGEKHPSAIIQPEWVFLKEWCARKEIPFEGNSKIIQNPRVVQRFQKEIDHFNERFGKWEQIKKFELTADTWSIQDGQLTPTLKLKRKNIVSRYVYLYEKMYGHAPR